MNTTEQYLAHAKVYDPVARRERYLRNRQLKGRSPGASDDGPSRPRSGGAANAALRASQREKLKAEQAALEKRLVRLKEVLRELVDDAKKRSGVKEAPEKESSSPSKTTNSEDKKGKGTPDKPLTESQKREKRKDSKERYEEEKRTSLARDVESLRGAISEIQAKIRKAQQEARSKPTKSTQKPTNSRR